MPSTLAPEGRGAIALVEHLEGALAVADELHESSVGYLIEYALDQMRAGDVDRLRGERR